MLGLSGCISPEAARKIEGTAAQEGTGVFLSRLPQVIRILATYEATEQQRDEALKRAQRIFARIEADVEAGRRKEMPRLLAVETEPDDRLRGRAAVVLWDTQTEEVVGNRVYDVEALPPVDTLARWDTEIALYAGR